MTQTHIAQDGLELVLEGDTELLILLPSSLKCQDYKHTPPHWFPAEVGNEQSFVHSRQAFYQLSDNPSPTALFSKAKD